MNHLLKRILCISFAAVMLLCTGCVAPENDDQTQERPKLSATVNGIPAAFLTVPDKYVKFVQQEEDAVKVYDVAQLDRDSGLVIDVDTSRTYQPIEGFGASLTESACINLWKMPEELRNQVMNTLFDPNKGIGLNILRQPIGISDFSIDPNRDFVDDNDTTLESFSIAYDQELIIPLIKQAMQIADCGEDFKVFACSWTAPLWMKTIPEYHSKNQSTLKREYYGLFAKYLVKAIEAYEAEGIPVAYITGQNEPSGIHGIAAMYMTSDNMATLINMYLKPELDKAGLDTKIMCWDFNYTDGSTYTMGKTVGNVGGLAYHVYGGDFAVLENTHALFPDIPLYITEAAGKIQSNSACFFRQIMNMSKTIRAGSRAHILWNIVLDEDRGPALLDENGKSVNTIGVAMIEYNTQTQEVAYLMDYYALGHFSKFIRPGAVLVDSTDVAPEFNDNVTNVVCRNENGTMTAVLTNNDGEDHIFKLVVGDKVIEYTLGAKSAVTLTWDANVY